MLVGAEEEEEEEVRLSLLPDPPPRPAAAVLRVPVESLPGVPMDVDLIHQALQIFPGTHNFRAFSSTLDRVAEEMSQYNLEFTPVRTVAPPGGAGLTWVLPSRDGAGISDLSHGAQHRGHVLRWARGRCRWTSCAPCYTRASTTRPTPPSHTGCA